MFVEKVLGRGRKEKKATKWLPEVRQREEVVGVE